MAERLILSDLDGTVVNLIEQLQLWVYRQTDVWFPRERIRKFDLIDDLWEVLCENSGTVGKFKTREGVTDAIRHSFFTQPQPYAIAQPCYPVWNGLRACKEAIVYITARPESLKEVTTLWLHDWGLGDPTVIYTKDKLEEIEAFQNSYPSIALTYIDDKAEDVIRVQQQLPGVDCWLVAQPWNRWARNDRVKRWSHDQIATRLRWWRQK